MNVDEGFSRGRHGSMPFVTGGKDVQCTKRFQHDASFSIPPPSFVQRGQMNAFHFSSLDKELLRLESISSPTTSDPTVHELSNMLLSLKHSTLKINKTNAIRRNKGSSTLTNVTTPSNPSCVPSRQKKIDGVESISAFVTSSKFKRDQHYTKVPHLAKQELYRKLHDRYVNLNKELQCTRKKIQKAEASSSYLSDDSIRSVTRTRNGVAADIFQPIDKSLKNPQSHNPFRQRERLHYFQKYQKKKKTTQELNFLYKRKRIASLSSSSKLIYSSSLSDVDQHLSLSRIESSAQHMNYANPLSRRTSGNTHLFQPSQLSHLGRCGQNRTGDYYSYDEKQKQRIIAEAIRVLQNDHII